MVDREKVINGLEHCIGDNCSGDKWSKCEYSGHGCIDALLEDAIALYKAQEPRVMTLEEVQAFCVDDVVWLEDKGKTNIIPGIVRNRHLWPHSATMVTNFMRGDGCKVTADDDNYGKRWRCWTSKPSEEQRKAAEWQ